MKIAVAMSGGVDSSSRRGDFKGTGHELVGFTMQLWDQRRGSTSTKTAIRCLRVAVRWTTFTTRVVWRKSLAFRFTEPEIERDFLNRARRRS